MLRILIKRGHNLCKEIWEYTFGQTLFLKLCEEKEYVMSLPPAPSRSDMTIPGEAHTPEEVQSMKNKFRMWAKIADR